MQELENSFIELKYKVWQEMSLAGRSVATSNEHPRHQLSIEYLSAIAQSDNGIKNDHNNCWMSSILQILCGTDIYKYIEGSKSGPLKTLLSTIRTNLVPSRHQCISLKKILEVREMLGIDITTR